MSRAEILPRLVGHRQAVPSSRGLHRLRGNFHTLPSANLFEGSGQRCRHAVGPGRAETLLGTQWIDRAFPQAHHDAVLREAFADALAEGTRLRERERR